MKPGHPRPRRGWRIWVGLVLLALILSYAGPRQIWAAWTGISLVWFVPAALIFGVAHLSLVEGLRICLSALGVEVRRSQVVATHFEALFVGSFLPSSLGADVFKVIDLGRRARRWIHVGLGVAAQRAVALVMVVATLAATLPAAVTLDFQGLADKLSALWPWMAVAAVISAVAAAIFLSPARRQSLARQILEAVGALRQMGARALLGVFTCQALALGLNILGCFWVSRSLGLGIEWIHFCYLMPATYLAIALPVTVSGLGVREGVYVTLLGAQGVSPSQAVALSLTIFSLSLLYACVGGAVHMLRSDPTDPTRPEGPSVDVHDPRRSPTSPAGTDTSDTDSSDTDC